MKATFTATKVLASTKLFNGLLSRNLDVTPCYGLDNHNTENSTVLPAHSISLHFVMLSSNISCCQTLVIDHVQCAYVLPL